MPLVALGLNQIVTPPNQGLAIDATIVGVASVPDHPVPTTLQGREYHFLEHVRIDSSEIGQLLAGTVDALESVQLARGLSSSTHVNRFPGSGSPVPDREQQQRQQQHGRAQQAAVLRHDGYQPG